MPFYHATHRNKLPSILKYGLGGSEASERNFDCENGVYLATRPEIAFGFLIEHYLEKGSPQSDPSSEIENFVVIVIDDSRISGPVRVDPQIPAADPKCFLHDGMIDIHGMPILDADVIFPELKLDGSYSI